MTALAGLLGRVPQTYRGGILLACGISIVGVTDNLTLLVSDTVGVGQFHSSRSLMAVAMILGVALLTRTSVLPKVWWAVGLRTFFITCAMLLFFSVLPMMPVAEAGACLFTSPIFVLLFSRVLFGERLGPGRVMAVVAGSLGVLLVLKPGSAGFTVYHLMPMLAGAFYALNSLVTYRYCQQESPLTLTMAFFTAIGIGGGLFTGALTVFPAPAGLLADAPFLFRGWVEVDAAFWLTLLVIACGGIVAIFLISHAYQLTQTSYAIVYEYVYLIAAGITGWAMWGALPDRLSIVGIMFIVAAGVIITQAQRSTLRSVAGSQE